MDQKERRKAFRDWTTYAGESHFDPWLRYLSKASKQERLLSFAALVLESSGVQSRLDTNLWTKALRYVAQTLIMAGFKDPRKTQGSDDLDLPFQHHLLG
jgi:hypothetical protein